MKSKDEPLIPFKTIDYIFGILVLFVSFGVYLHTLTPTVGFHDSGELISVAYTLGIAHPPGYPLYTLLGKVFITLIPIGNIAFRMNMQSALFASLCVMMTYFITLRLTSLIIPSIVASLTLAFSLTFWEQAVIAEKYTLNALFATLIIFILLKWEENLKFTIYNLKFLYLFSFILGLSFTHHFQTIYLVPASVFFILATLIKNRGKGKKKLQSDSVFCLLSSVFFFLLPLTLWAYLPLRASQEPVLNWGDPDTTEKFINHITARHYKSYFTSSPKVILSHLINQLNFLPHQFNILLIIALFGLFVLFKKRLLFTFFFFIIFSNILYSVSYDIPNIEDYYIPSFIILSIFIGIGLFLIRRFSILLYLSLFLIFLPISKNYNYNNRTFYYLAYDLGNNVLMTFKSNPIILECGDNTGFPLLYLNNVLRKRADLIHISLPFLKYPWYNSFLQKVYKDEFSFSVSAIGYTINLSDYLYSLILRNINSHSIYIEEPEYINSWRLIPNGLFFKAASGNEGIPDISYKIRGLGRYKDWRSQITFKNYAIAYTLIGKEKEAERIRSVIKETRNE